MSDNTIFAKSLLKSAFLSKNPAPDIIETNKISGLWSLFGDKASGQIFELMT
jgi:hypothetical protein